MFKAKKAEDLKINIQIHIAKFNSIIREKKSFRANQVLSFQSRYMAKTPDLTPQFENIIKADIIIEKATQTQNYLKTLFQNTDLLVDSKKLPEDIKFALEYCFYFSQIDKQKDLNKLLDDIIKIHKSKKHPRTTHETKVFFNTEKITEEDAIKYYPAIKNECNLQEDEYLKSALKKYSCIFQAPQQQIMPPSMQPNVTMTFQMPPPNFGQIPQCNNTQNLNQLPQFTQQPQFINQNLNQPPQFTLPNMNQFTIQNMSQLPQSSTQNMPQNFIQTQQPGTQNLGQPPQFIPQNFTQMSQPGTQNLGQPPQFTPQNFVQMPQSGTQNLGQSPQFTPQNFTQMPQSGTQNLGQPPQFTPNNSSKPPKFTPQN